MSTRFEVRVFTAAGHPDAGWRVLTGNYGPLYVLGSHHRSHAEYKAWQISNSGRLEYGVVFERKA